MFNHVIFQVANYGIGGHFEEHYDFSFNAFSYKKSFSNRVATWLFYLEVPERGGATVFTKINATVNPTRGSAVFWHNMHANGNLDYRTMHAGCPVLFGQKWVSNKWLHVIGQEFKRPCKLINDE